MLTDPEFQTEIVQLPHNQCVAVVCKSEERSLLLQSKQTFNFSLPLSASVDEVRQLLAEKLSTVPASVHLQVLAQEGHEYETMTRGSIADLVSACNPRGSALTVVYSTESRYGYFYICCAAMCAACCCLGYQAGKSD